MVNLQGHLKGGKLKKLFKDHNVSMTEYYPSLSLSLSLSLSHSLSLSLSLCVFMPFSSFESKAPSGLIAWDLSQRPLACESVYNFKHKYL